MVDTKVKTQWHSLGSADPDVRKAEGNDEEEGYGEVMALSCWTGQSLRVAHPVHPESHSHLPTSEDRLIRGELGLEDLAGRTGE